MATAPVTRSSRARARRRQGLRNYKVDADEVALAAYLASPEIGLLNPNTDNHAEIEKALAQLIRTLILEK